MNTLYRAALGVAVFFFISWLPAQQLERLTDYSRPFLKNNQAIDYATKDGKIYMLKSGNYVDGNVFAVLDPATGEQSPLPADRPLETSPYVRPIPQFTQLGEHLFAKVGMWRPQHQLVLVEKERVVMLNPPGVGVVSNPVAFRGEYYFLALTEPTVNPSPEATTLTRSLTLWKTDATPGGTRQVAVIQQATTAFYSFMQRNFLLAG